MKERLNVEIVQPLLRTVDESPSDTTKRVTNMILSQAAATAAADVVVSKTSHQQQQQQSIDIFVLPELCPIGYLEDTFVKFLPDTPEIKSIYYQIDKEMQDTAKKCQTFICYGTIGWKNENLLEQQQQQRKQQYFIR